MAKLSKSIVILGAKRTAFGTLQGTLKGITATELGVVASKAAMLQAGVRPEQIEQVIFGNVMQTSADAIYGARHIGLKAGLPITAPALTVNRLCGSGFQAVISGAEQLLLGDAECVLVGGTENMTQAPHLMRGGRDGFAFGKAPVMEDSLFAALTDSFCNLPMGITAENLAVKYGLSRQDCDALALSSQQRWASANERGFFKDEIAPVEIVTKKGTTVFAVDEHPRPQSSAEALAKLNPVFKKDGVVTAGNASGINDGAAALVLATEDFAKANNLKPLARVVNWGVAGVDPAIMGIGPVPAMQHALKRAELSLSDMDLIEVNEAFAAQYLAVEKELSLNREKTNVNGGAIAIGHPLGASGARITTHLVYELQRRSTSLYAIGSACIGGGQGLAILLERM
jgi:acetyl-CoA acyltransferase 2